NDMAGELRDQLDRAVHVLEDQPVDLGEIVLHQIRQPGQGVWLLFLAFLVQIDDDGHALSSIPPAGTAKPLRRTISHKGCFPWGCLRWLKASHAGYHSASLWPRSIETY